MFWGFEVWEFERGGYDFFSGMIYVLCSRNFPIEHSCYWMEFQELDF